MNKIIFVFALSLIINTAYLAQEKNPLGYKGLEFYSYNKTPHILLNRSIAEQSHITWSTGNHTSSPVPVGSVGPAKYTKQLKGVIQNTKIAEIMKQAIGDKMNVILVIGDGMGVNHMSLPIYMRIAEGNSEQTYFEKIMQEGESGLVLTNPHNGLVTCSAAAGTAIATGSKALLDIISLDNEGNPVKSVLSLAEEKGYVTGLVTDASITDATPACFYAHEINRNNENNIAAQLINNNDIEVILGGGGGQFIPAGTKLRDQKEFTDFPESKNSNSDRKDSLNLISSFINKRYKVINTKDELQTLNSKTKKVLGLFAGGGLSAAIDRDDEITGEPSLVLMAEKDLEILSMTGKKFFTMIECGRIDWEAHDNDAGAVYKAVEEMNSVLGKCYQFYSKNKSNTLLIFTADHETGGLGFAYTKVERGNEFKKQLISGQQWISETDPQDFQSLLKLKQQKRTMYKIFEEAQSPNHLMEVVNRDFGYKIVENDAEEIFNSIHNYRKQK